MIQSASVDLFSGIPVTDYAAARQWYEQLLGFAPAFYPNDIEAVWQVAEHRYVYIVQQPERAGHAILMLLVEDILAVVAAISARGIQPAKQETFEGSMRKVTYRDADGNEIAFGGVVR